MQHVISKCVIYIYIIIYILSIILSIYLSIMVEQLFFSLARIERLSGIPSDDAAARAATKELGFTTLHLNRDFEVSYSEVFN